MNVSRPGPRASVSDRPRFWPRQGVKIAVRALPAGALRDRYQHEFIAELHGMARHKQAAHALGVITHAFALRAALVEGGQPREAKMQRRNMLCRLNVHHAWRIDHTEDGARYLRCIRCGKDYPYSGNSPHGFWG